VTHITTMLDQLKRLIYTLCRKTSTEQDTKNMKMSIYACTAFIFNRKLDTIDHLNNFVRYLNMFLPGGHTSIGTHFILTSLEVVLSFISVPGGHGKQMSLVPFRVHCSAYVSNKDEISDLK